MFPQPFMDGEVNFCEGVGGDYMKRCLGGGGFCVCVG